MVNTKKRNSEKLAGSEFSLGIFGDTRSGKTVYLTALDWMAREGQLPEGYSIRAADPETANYLGRRLASIRSGQWPEGTIDSSDLKLVVEMPGRTLSIETTDFRGGDFAEAFFEGKKEDCKQFVDKLFGQASAYIFLVDPTELEASGRQDQELVRERRGRSIENAMNILLERTHGLSVFHHPVAIVFTKCDLYPEAQEDPEGFARRLMKPTWDYLRKHCPRKSYRFFGISSTGKLAYPDKPPVQLKPQGLLEPLDWCAKGHDRRSTFYRRCIAAVFLVALLAGYGLLYWSHDTAIAVVRESVPVAKDDELPSYFRKTCSWQGTSCFMLTHPSERQQVQCEVLDAALHRAERAIDITGPTTRPEVFPPPPDSPWGVRSIDGYVSLRKLAEDFQSNYPQTDQGLRLEAFAQRQRSVWAMKQSKRLQDAGRDANPDLFIRLLGEYAKVATPEADKEVDRAKRLLDERVALRDAESLYYARTRAPSDLKSIRELCTKAEETVKGGASNTQQYIEAIRALYDDLAVHGVLVPLSLESIETSDSSEIWWRVYLVADLGNEKDVGSSSAWGYPYEVSGSWRKLSIGKELTIDFWSTSKVRVTIRRYVGLLSAYDDANPRWTIGTLANGDDKFSTNTEKGVSYAVRFSGERLRKLWALRATVERLEDDLFRKKRE